MRHRRLDGLLALYLCIAPFAGYMTFEHQHPPSHTEGGLEDCDCPGDWTPDRGSRPTASAILTALLGVAVLIQDASLVADPQPDLR